MRLLRNTEMVQSVQNSVHYLEDEAGYFSFLRFTPKQLSVYESDPFYRLMSYCSSGVCLAFETNGDQLSFECKTADFNTKMLNDIKGEMTIGQILQQLGETVKKVNQAGSRLDILQHFDLYVDNAYRSAVKLKKGHLLFTFPNPEHKWLRIKVFFPLYKPLFIRNITLSGEWRSYSEKRPLLYAFGDSITQGFIAGKPSMCYISQLACVLSIAYPINNHQKSLSRSPGIPYLNHRP